MRAGGSGRALVGLCWAPPPPHLHQQLPAGQVVVMVREDVRQLLKHQHTVPAADTRRTLGTRWDLTPTAHRPGHRACRVVLKGSEDMGAHVQRHSGSLCSYKGWFCGETGHAVR